MNQKFQLLVTFLLFSSVKLDDSICLKFSVSKTMNGAWDDVVLGSWG